MSKNIYDIQYALVGTEELEPHLQSLREQAIDAASCAYAPYSHFRVGAAVLLDDGTVVQGSNQENAAYPSGLCAERTALFYANAQYPDRAVVALAVVAISPAGKITERISPCGACRQVMAEVAARFKPFEVLLCGANQNILLDDNRDLLPLAFTSEALYTTQETQEA